MRIGGAIYLLRSISRSESETSRSSIGLPPSPIRAQSAAERPCEQSALGLHLPLALDAHGAVGQGVEPRHRDPARHTPRTCRTCPLLSRRSARSTWASSFASELGERGGDFLAAGIERGIGRVARSRRVLGVSEVFQFDPQPLAKLVAAGEQGSYGVAVMLLAVPCLSPPRCSASFGS